MEAGKPQKQAVAIAFKRYGKIKNEKEVIHSVSGELITLSFFGICEKV